MREPNDQEPIVTNRAKEFAKKLRGVSTPLFGVEWEPGADERAVVYRLIQALSNRRLVHNSHGEFGFPAAIRSLEQMRSDVTTALAELGPDSRLRIPLEALRADLQAFQTFVEREFDANRRRDTHPSDDLLMVLGAFRRSASTVVGRLCSTCGIEPSSDLRYSLWEYPSEVKRLKEP